MLQKVADLLSLTQGIKMLKAASLDMALDSVPIHDISRRSIFIFFLSVTPQRSAYAAP
ncbi:hypothetical protein [Paenibacillus camerounensis]|uniref:hypothetical protein n=1 Tax=Paenibacillus camerounensis TaxID=1243663 RepID=UPI001FCC752A|nr:hypothetical protein [Paenibacillus camerounensis]